jgi:integrase
MTQARIPRTPSYRLHKPTGQAFVEINGRRHYLGKYELPETQRAYHTLIAEWMTNGYRLPVPPDEITMVELTDAYLEYAAIYYRDAKGNPTSTYADILSTVKKLLTLYRDILATSFGPNALRNVRQLWINDNLSISTINTRVGIIKRIFQWAASNEMLPVTAYQALATLPGLRRGRGFGKDPVPRETIPLDVIDKTLDYLSAPLCAAIRIQLYTGARPSEILALKRGDIDCKGDIWMALLRDHKTSYLGKQRRIFFGPRAQSVLRPFLLRSDNAFLFSPKESISQRHQDAMSHRRPNQSPNPRKTERTLHDFYDAHGYRRAIARACKAAGVETWCPYRLRHTAATLIEASADMETAKAILGHSSINITQVYVHRDNKTAAAWAALHG